MPPKMETPAPAPTVLSIVNGDADGMTCRKEGLPIYSRHWRYCTQIDIRGDGLRRDIVTGLVDEAALLVKANAIFDDAVNLGAFALVKVLVDNLLAVGLVPGEHFLAYLRTVS